MNLRSGIFFSFVTASIVTSWLPTKACAVIVTNVTTDTVIFNSSGFEHDTPEHEPFALLQKSSAAKLWKTAVAPWDQVVSMVDRYIHRLPPATRGGFRYLKTTRNAAGEGKPVAMFSSNQARTGDLIRMEFSLQLPAEVDASITLGHDDRGEVRGRLRLHDKFVQYHDGMEWKEVKPRVAFLPEKWQDWRLEYAVGAATFTVRINDGPVGTAEALKSLSERGGGSLNRLSFEHLREQSFNIDATDTMRATAAAARKTEVQASQDLPQLLSIRWRVGPDLPQGVQTVATGVVDEKLIWLGGFCSSGTLYPGNLVPGKPDRYPRGYVDRTWSLDLRNSTTGWQSLPTMPAAARQAQTSAVVGESLYVMGGFNYESLAFQDTYRLSHAAGAWTWERLADLPWKCGFAGAATVGDRVFMFGGADIGKPPGGIYRTAADRNGEAPRLGARLIALDTKNLAAGWQELPACPGTPRFMPATAFVGEYFYVFGGLTGFDNPQKQVHVVVDNWRFKISAQTWERLDDLPVGASRHPNNYIAFQNRYVLLIGGGPMKNVMNPDGTTRPTYGRPHRTQWGRTTFSDITVYDTQTGKFGRANPLPLCNNMPTAVLHRDTLYLIGGECEGVEFNGVHYGHHPDLLLVGDITRIDQPMESVK